jgi:hypothetical protein
MAADDSRRGGEPGRNGPGFSPTIHNAEKRERVAAERELARREAGQAREEIGDGGAGE